MKRQDALRTEVERLRADAERSEQHRNDLYDKIVSLKTELGAVRSREVAVESLAAERAAEVRRLQAALEWMRARDDRNGSLPDAYRVHLDMVLAASGGGDDAKEKQP